MDVIVGSVKVWNVCDVGQVVDIFPAHAKLL